LTGKTTLYLWKQKILQPQFPRVFWMGRRKEITNELNGLNVIIKEYGLDGDWGFQRTWTQISE
jgi:hypothetical protein